MSRERVAPRDDWIARRVALRESSVEPPQSEKKERANQSGGDREARGISIGSTRVLPERVEQDLNHSLVPKLF